MAPFIYKYFIPFAILLTGSTAVNAGSKQDPASPQLPAVFRKNAGQWKESILYQSSSNGSHVSFLKNELSYGFRRSITSTPPRGNEAPNDETYECLVWNLSFQGANPNSTLSADGELPSNTNYFKGGKHIAHVPDYSTLTYHELYKNIDLRYYSTGTSLKYDYVLKEHADPGAIRMLCKGVKGLKIDGEGQLIIQTAWGELMEKKPFSYQMTGGLKKEIDVRYCLLNDSTFGFRVYGQYDPHLDLVIDPVILQWSTFVGGSSPGGGYIYDITLDAAGNVFGAGYYNNGFPTTPGSYHPAYNTPSTSCGFAGGDEDAFAFKMDPNGTSLIWCTYIGGDCRDRARGITIDASGNAYVTGWTESTNFPTVGPFQASNAGMFDAFGCKLDPTGSTLIYSTYFGGTSSEWGEKVAVNANGEAYYCGSTQYGTASPGFPTTPGSVQPAYGGGSWQADGYVLVLNAAGNGLIYSTYLGGNGYDWAYSIKLNAAGEAFVTGKGQTNFPTTAGAFQTVNGGGDDVFVCRINASGSAFIYSTLIGGNGGDVGNSIAINSADEAFITGNVHSTNYPTTVGAYSSVYAGGTYGDAFATRLNSSGNALIASTYIGTPTLDIGWGIDIDVNNNIFVAGYTDNASFPTTVCAVDQTYNGSSSPNDADYFFLKLDPNCSILKYSTYIGGNGQDYWEPKIKLYGTPCNQSAVCSGTSHSTNFPTTPGVIQPVKLNGVDDQPVVLKLSPRINPGFTINPNPACANVPVTFTDTTHVCGLWGDTLTIHQWNFGDSQTGTGKVVTHTYLTTGTYTVTMIVGCPMDTVWHVITVTNGTTTSAITGPTPVCPNAVGTIYSVINTPGSTYNWTVPAGAVIISGQGTNSISVNWGTTGGTITCTETNACGTGTPVTFTVTIGGGPVTSAITGISPLCPNTTGTVYSVVNSTGSTYSWTVPSGATIVSGQGSNSIVVNWGGNGGAVTVTETSSCGTGAPVTFNVTLDAIPVIQIHGDSLSGCPALTVHFTDQSTISSGSVTAWHWAFGDGNTSSQQNPTNTYLNSGAYSVTLTLTTNLGCTATYTSTNYITVYPVPEAAFGSTANVSMENPLDQFTDLSTSAVSWAWNFGDGGTSTLQNPAHAYASPGTYPVLLIVKNQYGCSDSALTDVIVKDVYTFFIPNAFSPNNDGLNDNFEGIGTGIASYEMWIFDRWGELIYKTEDYGKPWDGRRNTGVTSSQIVQEDVYVYKINVTDIFNTGHYYVGHVSVIK